MLKLRATELYRTTSPPLVGTYWRNQGFGAEPPGPWYKVTRVWYPDPLWGPINKYGTWIVYGRLVRDQDSIENGRLKEGHEPFWLLPKDWNKK